MVVDFGAGDSCKGTEKKGSQENWGKNNQRIAEGHRGGLRQNADSLIADRQNVDFRTDTIKMSTSLINATCVT
jgi:hypothetical protein